MERIIRGRFVDGAARSSSRPNGLNPGAGSRGRRPRVAAAAASGQAPAVPVPGAVSGRQCGPGPGHHKQAQSQPTFTHNQQNGLLISKMDYL